MIYKLRAECKKDVMLFVINENITSYKIEYSIPSPPDTILIFETILTLNEIISILKKQEDSHVMYQTVKKIEDYTGDRNYEI